jgi:cyclopropane fatty-acyl-phospholipid synthase-like methyltransferase
MGYDDRERRRLAIQASILNPFTEQLLRRAGVASGMRVLDLGCGVGDVSMIAARLVGRYGRVTAVDTDESALATAWQRAQQQSLYPERVTTRQSVATFSDSGQSVDDFGRPSGMSPRLRAFAYW